MRWQRAATGGLVAVSLAASAASGGWWWFTSTLPSVEPLADYTPAEVTVLVDRDGELMGELYEERRYVLPIEAIPEHVQLAFVAAEDASFHHHGGVDFRGIARAALRNVDDGRAAQGASTITQQVVKNLILDDRTKSITRKVKEVALAWAVEDRFDKDHILFLYLNSIYLGAQSYGVEAAARTYFGKHASELTLGEAALLAGLPQRPSDTNPYKNPDRAARRQRYVLDQMAAKGFVTREAAEAAAAEPLVYQPPNNHFRDLAPDFTEHVRRWLVDRYGEEAVRRGGLRVTTTCDLDLQRHAKQVVLEQVTEYDRESGYRRTGKDTLPADAIDAWRREHAVDGPLVADRDYAAVVLSVASDRARIAVGDQELMLSIADHRWIRPGGYAGSFLERQASPEERRAYWQWRQARDAEAERRIAEGLPPEESPPPAPPEPGRPMLQTGDLVTVRLLPGATGKARDGRDLPRAVLTQERELEGALLSMELDTGAVRALVGGADFERSQFNRATQGRRQVGSTFKPIVYAAAIEARTHTAATVVSDEGLSLPIGGGQYWSPRGAGEPDAPPMTLLVALARSRNLVLLRTLIAADEWMDDDLVYRFARRLGLGGPPSGALPEGWVSTPRTDTLCVWTPEADNPRGCRDHHPPDERPTDPRLADPLKDRRAAEEALAAHLATLPDGAEHLCRSCDYSLGLGSASLTVAEMVRAYSVFGTDGRLVEPQYVEAVHDRRGQELYRMVPMRPQVVDPGVAYVVHTMLQAVVQRGTGHAARAVKAPVAGKTGTTDDGRDVWFVGYSPTVATGVWVGFDQPQPIGGQATGGRVALPIWVAYMKAAVDPEATWTVPGPEHVVFANIDEASGGRVSEGGVRYPFLPGTVPAPAPAAVDDGAAVDAASL